MTTSNLTKPYSRHETQKFRRILQPRLGGSTQKQLSGRLSIDIRRCLTLLQYTPLDQAIHHPRHLLMQAQESIQRGGEGDGRLKRENTLLISGWLMANGKFDLHHTIRNADTTDLVEICKGCHPNPPDKQISHCRVLAGLNLRIPYRRAHSGIRYQTLTGRCFNLASYPSRRYRER